ncbi:MAG: ABC transporter permease, partial [Bacteroidetes bacterium]|nr:ABC transporter permease [Bacteroidota bacterium]
MIRLLKIDLLKNLNFNAFLIMVAMYFISLGAITAS